MKVAEAIKLINEAKKYVAVVSIRTRDGQCQAIDITKSQALELIMDYDADEKIKVRLGRYGIVYIG